MTVIECIKAAAVELGIEKRVSDYLDGRSLDGEAETNELLRCFNLEYSLFICYENFV